jgi:hypothetical protein
MNRRVFFVTAVSSIAVAGVAYSGWRFIERREHHSCRACSRPVHEHMRTIAAVDGQRGVYCCPACALSEHQQAGRPVQVVELTDFLTGKSLEPSGAYLVRDSNVNPCSRHEPSVTSDKQPMHTHFDRCSPSLLAFRDAQTAQTFTAERGGQILRFAELASQFQR